MSTVTVQQGARQPILVYNERPVPVPLVIEDSLAGCESATPAASLELGLATGYRLPSVEPSHADIEASLQRLRRQLSACESVLGDTALDERQRSSLLSRLQYGLQQEHDARMRAATRDGTAATVTSAAEKRLRLQQLLRGHSASGVVHKHTARARQTAAAARAEGYYDSDDSPGSSSDEWDEFADEEERRARRAARRRAKAEAEFVNRLSQPKHAPATPTPKAQARAAAAAAESAAAADPRPRGLSARTAAALAGTQWSFDAHGDPVTYDTWRRHWEREQLPYATPPRAGSGAAGGRPVSAAAVSAVPCRVCGGPAADRATKHGCQKPAAACMCPRPLPVAVCRRPSSASMSASAASPVSSSAAPTTIAGSPAGSARSSSTLSGGPLLRTTQKHPLLRSYLDFSAPGSDRPPSVRRRAHAAATGVVPVSWRYWAEASGRSFGSSGSGEGYDDFDAEAAACADDEEEEVDDDLALGERVGADTGRLYFLPAGAPSTPLPARGQGRGSQTDPRPWPRSRDQQQQQQQQHEGSRSRSQSRMRTPSRHMASVEQFARVVSRHRSHGQDWAAPRSCSRSQSRGGGGGGGSSRSYPTGPVLTARGPFERYGADNDSGIDVNDVDGASLPAHPNYVATGSVVRGTFTLRSRALPASAAVEASLRRRDRAFTGKTNATADRLFAGAVARQARAGALGSATGAGSDACGECAGSAYLGGGHAPAAAAAAAAAASGASSGGSNGGYSGQCTEGAPQRCLGSRRIPGQYLPAPAQVDLAGPGGSGAGAGRALQWREEYSDGSDNDHHSGVSGGGADSVAERRRRRIAERATGVPGVTVSATGRLAFEAARGAAHGGAAGRRAAAERVANARAGAGGSRGVTVSVVERHSAIPFEVRSGGADAQWRRAALAGRAGAPVARGASAQERAQRRDLGMRVDFEVGGQTWVSSHPHCPRYLRHSGTVRKDLRTELAVADYSAV